MSFREIDLAAPEQPLPRPVVEAMTRFRDVHPGSGFGFPSKFDYRRLGVAFERVRGAGSVLDVGVGSGQLINALALSGKFERVCGIDVVEHERFTRFTDDFEQIRMSVAEMSFEDAEFDAVICMEVLEHLPPNELEPAISELRRVARSQLLMTVPFEEPEPLPRYHKSRFELVDLERAFPEAELTLLRRPTVSWMLLEERSPQPVAD